jgi:hypothetical protein
MNPMLRAQPIMMLEARRSAGSNWPEPLRDIHAQPGRAAGLGSKRASWRVARLVRVRFNQFRLIPISLQVSYRTPRGM